MTLHPSDRFGRYIITEWLGAGGMSDVYRALDEQLHREVALKVLSDGPGRNPQRLARFEREAQALASLNHPNIATLLGTEDDGDVRAIVMEVVEGETLAERQKRDLGRGEALRIARQIAAALESAHERGIIHRDLKPSNIKIRPDGTVKVLDFGLAKILTLEEGGADVTAATVTVTGAFATVVGTAAYMSPEQARGTSVDRRTDVWSFGCVLYEMLAGRRAFDGATASDAIANVINREPDLEALPAGTPAAIRRLIRRCLQKDVSDRLRDIGDARLEVEDALASDDDEAVHPRSRRPSARRVTSLVALTAVAAVAAAGTWIVTRETPSTLPVSRFVLAPPVAVPFIAGGPRSSLAISSDGSLLAYRSTEGSWGVRSRNDLRTTVVGGAGVFINEAFFSPDGSWLAFFEAADGGMNMPRAELRKVPARGGASTVIASVGPRFLGGSWYTRDAMVFAVAAGVFRVSADGGEPHLIATPDKARGEQTLGWPEVLPGGRSALITASQATGETIAILDLETGSRRPLLPGSRARLTPTGHLVYSNRGTLYAVAFNLARLEVVGEPVALIENMSGTDYALSSDGTLAYVSGGPGRELVWVDRHGREEPIPAPRREYVYPRLSPDGTRIALDIGGPNRDIWIWDFARQTLTRLTSDPAEDLMPAWTPDGARVAFGRRSSVSNLFWQAADGSGAAEPLNPAAESQVALSFTPDGRHLLFAREARDILSLSLDGSRTIEPLVTSGAVEINAEVSPDGDWMVYSSNESGRFEIVVRSLRAMGGAKFQVSRGGGTQALWSRDQREIFFRDPHGAVMAVPVTLTPRFALGDAVRLITGSGFLGAGSNVNGVTYDVSRDGQRFVMIKNSAGAEGAAPTSLVVVQNWHSELTRLLPRR